MKAGTTRLTHLWREVKYRPTYSNLNAIIPLDCGKSHTLYIRTSLLSPLPHKISHWVSSFLRKETILELVLERTNGNSVLQVSNQWHFKTDEPKDIQGYKRDEGRPVQLRGMRYGRVWQRHKELWSCCQEISKCYTLPATAWSHMWR